MAHLYLIDGYNLLHADPRLLPLASSNLEEARRQLAERVGAWCGTSGERALLIFDGTGRHAQPARRIPEYGGLEIVFTSHQQSADALIERAVYQMPNRHDAIAVSADRGITDFCISLGALAMKPDHFLEILRDQRQQDARKMDAASGGTSFGALDENLDDSSLDALRRLRDKLEPGDTP